MNDTAGSPSAIGSDLTIFNIIQNLWQNWMLIVRNVVGMAVLSVITALLLPLWFISQFTILPSAAGNQDILPSVMGIGSALSGLGFGVSSEELNSYISILKSREVRDHIIAEFDLVEMYEVNSIEDALFILDSRIDISISDEGALHVTVLDREPVVAKALADELLLSLGNTMTALGFAMGQRQRKFIATRIAAVELQLQQTEEGIQEFTREFGVFDLPAQLPMVIESLIQMEIQLIQAEIEYSVASSNAQQGSPMVAQLMSQRDEIKKQLNSMKHGEREGNIIPNIYQLPKISMMYAQFQREVLILSAILEYLYPQLEQAKLKEAKDEPTLQVLDYPKVPQKKAKPHRAMIVISATLFSLLISCIWVVFLPRLVAFADRIKNLDAP